MKLLKIFLSCSMIAFLSGCMSKSGQPILASDPLGGVRTELAGTRAKNFPYDDEVKVSFVGSAPRLEVQCIDAYASTSTRVIDYDKFVSDLKTLQSWMKKNKTAKIDYNKRVGYWSFYALESGSSFAFSQADSDNDFCTVWPKNVAELIREMRNYERVKAKHLSTDIPFK